MCIYRIFLEKGLKFSLLLGGNQILCCRFYRFFILFFIP